MENRNIFQVNNKQEKQGSDNQPYNQTSKGNPTSKNTPYTSSHTNKEPPRRLDDNSYYNTNNHETQNMNFQHMNNMSLNFPQYNQTLGAFPQTNQYTNIHNFNLPTSESSLFYQTYLTGLSMNLTIEDMVNQNILPVKKTTRNIKINGKDYLEAKYPSISQIQKKYSRPDVPIEIKPGSIFYIIKSFNIENIHKAIKYKVWSTTYQGNILFDNAFHDAQQSKGEVYLFFSTNSTFAFQGIARLKSGFQSKSFSFWRGSDKIQKFTGSFLIEWLIIKDVPNSTLDKILINGIPFSKLRNGVQVNEVDALRVIKMFESFYYCSSIVLSDFANLDKEEERQSQEHSKK